ncbi:eL24 family ribosomal protein [Candidatus Laterigemmans baculatus]|uniref:hypothetical protein n=1 Tax=Candidatus Laterigemmans baculatus TaxID=2770505 RepID=UPI001F2F0E56|nr:hypothetical protein [Candidatus Laterigemmans baculatus]
MLLKRIVCAVAVCGMLAGAVVAAEKAEISLEGVKCVVAPKAANAEKSASYKEGQVFFCCDGCKGKFTKDTEKFATKANQQLVATKQYEQKACPLSGGKVNPEKTVKVGNVEVGFCCGNCQGKVAAAEGDAQVALVFSEKAFEKGFTVKKAEK